MECFNRLAKIDIQIWVGFADAAYSDMTRVRWFIDVCEMNVLMQFSCNPRLFTKYIHTQTYIFKQESSFWGSDNFWLAKKINIFLEKDRIDYCIFYAFWTAISWHVCVMQCIENGMMYYSSTILSSTHDMLLTYSWKNMWVERRNKMYTIVFEG